jgi:hypothetical protein
MVRIDARSVKVFERPDAKARVEIYARNDGLYDFVIKEERVVEAEEFPHRPGYTYWASTSKSGLYETFEEAERAAISETPWLKLS